MNSEQLFGSAVFVPCAVHEYSRKHVLFAQMVGEWHFLYEYILMQTDIPGGATVFTNSPLTPCLKSLGHLVRNQKHCDLTQLTSCMPPRRSSKQ